MRFTISLKDDLMKKIDKAVAKSPFNTRSAFLSALIEKAIKDEAK